MAARNRSTIGMNHPTVVPTNFGEDDRDAGRDEARDDA